MLSLQTNVSAIISQNNLNTTSNSLGTAMERLSSGYRINRAADDAAGLAESEQMQAQIGGLTQAAQNSQDGISMIQTGEGALDQIQTMMQRMRSLAVQAASDTNGQADRDNINLELQQLGTEIDSISQLSQFNGQSLLNGSLVTSQIAGTQGWDGASTELAASTTALGGGETINSVDVGGSQQNMGYKVSTQSTAGNTITLTQVNSSGVTTGLSQTLNLTDIAAGQAEALNFSDFGVKFTVGNAANAAAPVAASTLVTDLGATLSIDAGTGASFATLQTGSNQGDVTTVQFMSTRLTGATGNAPMDGLAQALNAFNTTASADNASSLITAVDNALGSISSNRATLGAAQNRLNYTISNLGTASENLQQANSRIMDVDVATESSDMAKEQVLEQAGVSVLAQANQLPQLALKLLA